MRPPILNTNRFTLQPYRPEDEDRFVEMALDPVSTHFMGGSTGDEQNERALFKKIFEIYGRKEKRWFWIWGIYRGDLLCGHLELKETEHTNDQELETIYLVHPKERRKGVMTEVLALLKANQKCWNKRIIATVDADNTYSILLLKKWGIDPKGVLLNDETGEEYLKLTLSE